MPLWEIIISFYKLKLAELSGTKEIEEKVIFLSEIIEEAIIASENEISKEITSECNKKIQEMFMALEKMNMDL